MIDPAWLATQRWFRSKQRPIRSVREVERITLETDASLAALEVTFADGGSEHYLAPGGAAWPLRLAEVVRQGRSVEGQSAVLVGHRTEAAADSALPTAAWHALGVEQSNTSVVIGEDRVLKLYRLLEPGPNPEVEITAFLAASGFDEIAGLDGWVTWQSGVGEAAVALLQPRVRSRGDAWTAVLSALATDQAAGVAMSRALGAVTRRMHGALASHPEDPAFPARAATVDETAAWRASAERQLAQAVGAVSGAEHERLVALAPRLTARFADAFGSATGEARLSRIHGDYHLGQLLVREDDGFAIVDFEGEPARPLAERRQPGSPLRDVAGMLRSLDYAARTARADEAWLAEARAAFLEGYGGIGPGEAGLLAAFELEKACYEVRYEAALRPDWLWLPLGALERLVA